MFDCQPQVCEIVVVEDKVKVGKIAPAIAGGAAALGSLPFLLGGSGSTDPTVADPSSNPVVSASDQGFTATSPSPTSTPSPNPDENPMKAVPAPPAAIGLAIFGVLLFLKNRKGKKS